MSVHRDAWERLSLEERVDKLRIEMLVVRALLTVAFQVLHIEPVIGDPEADPADVGPSDR